MLPSASAISDPAISDPVPPPAHNHTHTPPPPHHTHTRTRTPLTHTLSLPQACLNLCLWSHEVVGPTSVVNGTSTYVLTQPLPAVGWRGGWITR
jgi:hypothetical protein